MGTTIDRDAISALAGEPLDWRHKAVPPDWWGRSVRDVVDGKPGLSDLPTPVVTLSAAAMRHNLATMARWCAERGLELAPHGKTTMAPALWSEQLDAGAIAITLANRAQLAVARAFGVRRVLLANEVVDAAALRWIGAELDADPEFEVSVWADSVRGVELMSAALDGAVRPVDVLVEVGAPGGRGGARDRRTAVEVARAVAAAPGLRLAGVAGYEGILAGDTDAASLEWVRGYLRELVAVHEQLAGLYDGGAPPLVTAGGSVFFDLVAEELAAVDDARVVLRSGCYLTHDDGEYHRLSALGRTPRTSGEPLVPALHAWVRVASQPEPGLALVDAGKRDVPYDMGMPVPQLLAGRPVDGLVVEKLNDQHGYLRFDPSRTTVRVGDVLRLGLSHPCTAFDKWSLMPVVDDADAADPVVVDLVRTYF